MTSLPQFVLGLLLTLVLFTTALGQTSAQTQQQQSSQPAAPVVTATANGSRVRYISMGEVHQTRLQVFSADGALVFDSNFRLGNLIDWQLMDQQGARLSDGSYLFLITVKDFSDRLTQKYGTALLEKEQVYLEQTDRSGLSQGQSTALESSRQADTLSTVDRIGAAGLARTSTPDATDSNPTKPAQPPGTVANSQPATVTTNVAGTGTAGKLTKWQDSAGTLTDSAVTESGGNIGIGNPNPAYLLELQKSSNPVLRLQDTGGRYGLFGVDTTGASLTDIAAAGDFVFRTNNGRILFTNRSVSGGFVFATGNSTDTAKMSILGNGNVGIGNTNPAYLLELQKSSNPVLRMQDSGGRYGLFGVDTTGASLTDIAAAGDFVFRTNNGRILFTNRSVSGGFVFATGNSTDTAKVTILGNGNVGIGNPNPVGKLDVAGDMNVSGNAVVTGNIAAKYQDVAEWVPARQKLASGTVVVLDKTRTNAVAASTRAYDTMIAGVVSAKPGVILGEGGDGKVLVATTGRVKVKVDARRYPIRIGDLLVTSEREGVAMRSLPIRVGGRMIHRPGTIIGKALEPLAGGEGEILVLLSLQ